MSQKMKRRLIGGVGMTAILTLFGAIVVVPIWSQSALTGKETREIVLEARDLAFGDANPILSFKPGEKIRLIVRNTDVGVLHSIRLPGIDDTLRHIPWNEEIAIEFTAPEKVPSNTSARSTPPRCRDTSVSSRLRSD